jgi:hypothetical protein
VSASLCLLCDSSFNSDAVESVELLDAEDGLTNLHALLIRVSGRLAQSGVKAAAVQAVAAGAACGGGGGSNSGGEGSRAAEGGGSGAGADAAPGTVSVDRVDGGESDAAVSGSAAFELEVVLPMRLMAALALGPVDVRKRFVDSDIYGWLLKALEATIFELRRGGGGGGDGGGGGGGGAVAGDDDLHAHGGSGSGRSDAITMDARTALAAQSPCTEALGGLAAVGTLRGRLASDSATPRILEAALALAATTTTATSAGGGAGGGRRVNVGALFATTRFLLPFLAPESHSCMAKLLVTKTLPALLHAVLDTGRGGGGRSSDAGVAFEGGRGGAGAAAVHKRQQPRQSQCILHK